MHDHKYPLAPFPLPFPRDDFFVPKDYYPVPFPVLVCETTNESNFPGAYIMIAWCQQPHSGDLRLASHHSANSAPKMNDAPVVYATGVEIFLAAVGKTRKKRAARLLWKAARHRIVHRKRLSRVILHESRYEVIVRVFVVGKENEKDY